MSSDNRGSSNPVPSTQQRRGSIPPGTSPATSLFQRRNSLAVSMAPPAIFSTPTTAGESNHRRRMSVSASLGLAGSAGGAFDYRRSSTSTTTDSIGESAVEDDDRNPSALPFARRMSVQPARSSIGSGGAVSAGGSPNTDQSFYDWGAHLRARAQSSVNTTRPVFGTSPPREPAPQPAAVPRATELPRPPVQPAPPKPQRAKPDAYQERILKGDFYMD
jgi:hypothetical protein